MATKADQAINKKTSNSHNPTANSRPKLSTFPSRVEHQEGNEPMVDLQDQF